METPEQCPYKSPWAVICPHGITSRVLKCVNACGPAHPALKREDRLGKDPFAGFGTVVEDITESGYTKNQPILLGAF